jgi:Recombination endonuclease VII
VGTVKRRPCSKCGINRAERFYSSPRGRVCLSCRKHRTRTTNHAARILKLYDITGAEYNRLFAAQGGRCAICGGKRKRLDVDHDHARERVVGTRASVRGLLCARCNRHLLPAAMGSVDIRTRTVRRTVKR